MKRNRYSKRREAYADKAEKSLSKLIRRVQNFFIARVADRFLGSLQLDGKLIKPTSSNLITASKVNLVYADIMRSNSKEIVRQIITDTKELHLLNELYFSDILNSKVRNKTILNNTFRALGLSPKGKLQTGGFLTTLLLDFSPINSLRQLIFNAVQSSLDISFLRNQIRARGKGTREMPGIIERNWNIKFPTPYQRIDRSTGSKFANSLNLNYAIYQGGLIETSRDFCEIRNNKVFTIEEIKRFGTPKDKFGGYTNKSAGEFQGKPNFYDPVTDLGGINCRHFLDYITEETAFLLRPELRKQN